MFNTPIGTVQWGAVVALAVILCAALALVLWHRRRRALSNPANPAIVVTVAFLHDRVLYRVEAGSDRLLDRSVVKPSSAALTGEGIRLVFQNAAIEDIGEVESQVIGMSLSFQDRFSGGLEDSQLKDIQKAGMHLAKECFTATGNVTLMVEGVSVHPE